MAHVSPPQANPGDELTASLINDPINAIADEFNGGIDNTNIAPDGVTRDNIEDASQVAMVGSYLPQGYGANYKISRSISSNNLIVSLKTKAGADPSASDPILFDIGGTVRSITSALSVTINAGANTFNSGSAELATLEVDYFAYLGWNTAASAVVLGISRIPNALVYSDFSSTPANEKYAAINNITGIASTDRFEVIGRTNAILGVSATYNWSLPGTEVTINRPIDASRWLSFTSTVTGFSGTPTQTMLYKVDRDMMQFYGRITGTSNTTAWTWKLPFNPINANTATHLFRCTDNTANPTAPAMFIVTNGNAVVTNFKDLFGAAWTAAGTKAMDIGVTTTRI